MNWLTSRYARAAAHVGAAAAGLFFLAGCEKDTESNVDLPTVTGVSTQYLEVPVSVSTVRLDSVPTLKADRYLVGRLRGDQVTGTTECRALLNLQASGLNDSLPGKFTAPVLDSLVLNLTFDQVYGSATTPARFDVYELGQKLDERAVYDARTAVPVGPLAAAGVGGRLNRTVTVTQVVANSPGDSVKVTVADPTLRLVLYKAGGPASALASRLFGALSTATSLDQTRLDNLWKGVLLKPSAGYESAVVSFGRSVNSRVNLYFHETTNNVTKKHFYPIFFGPSPSGAGGGAGNDPRYFTQIDGDLSGSLLAALSNTAQLVPAVASNGTSYVQAATGLGARIEFDAAVSQLRNIPNLAVNRAELRLPVRPFSTGLFANPVAVYALEINNNNRVLRRVSGLIATDRAVQKDGLDPTIAYSPSASLPVPEAEGVLVNGSTSNTYYSLVMTTYLQAYLGDKLGGEKPAALLVVSSLRRSSNLTLNRAALDAGNVKLRVYYSQLR